MAEDEVTRLMTSLQPFIKQVPGVTDLQCEGAHVDFVRTKSGVFICTVVPKQSATAPDTPICHTPPSTEEQFIQDVAKDVLPLVQSDGGVAIFHLFHDRYDSTVLEIVDTYSGNTIHEMLARVLRMQYSHAYCPRKDVLVQFTNTDRELAHRTMKAPVWYQKKWQRTLSSSPSHEDEKLLLFTENHLWNNIKHIGDFVGLAAVRKAVREQAVERKMEWSHCYCPTTKTIFDFHWKDGKLSQKQVFADANYKKREDGGEQMAEQLATTNTFDVLRTE